MSGGLKRAGVGDPSPRTLEHMREYACGVMAVHPTSTRDNFGNDRRSRAPRGHLPRFIIAGFTGRLNQIGSIHCRCINSRWIPIVRRTVQYRMSLDYAIARSLAPPVRHREGSQGLLEFDMLQTDMCDTSARSVR